MKEQRFEHPSEILGKRLREGSIYRLLADHGHELFGDEYFADLYTESSRGRPTVPARVLATVMVLQAFEGLSDREACDRLEVDLRWQAAAGVHLGIEAFHPTVLVGQRNRLRSSKRPRRLFEDTKVVAREAGVMGRRARVLDSTPIYDAVATQDTVTQLRAAIRKLLIVLDNTNAALAAQVRAALVRDDDYASAGKPPCDWDDPAAREALVDALVHDALAALAILDGKELTGTTRDAADLLALVAGQDVAEGDDGVFRIVRGVAKDRVISTVDPEARHGHKSKNRRFDGYKAHTSVDPDSELIDEVVLTPANTADRDAVEDLLDSLGGEEDKPAVVGDSAYADGATREHLENEGYELISKTPPARNATGGFTKDDFVIDPEANTATCPANNTVAIRPARGGGAGPASPPTATTARCGASAPAPGEDAPSPSIPKKRSCAEPAKTSVHLSGQSATGRTAQSWNARSPTSCDEPGAGEEPAPGDEPGWPAMSTLEREPSTWRASPCSASSSAPRAGP